MKAAVEVAASTNLDLSVLEVVSSQKHISVYSLSGLFSKNTLEFEPHPHLLGGVANYGIKLWGTNAAFFMPQGGVHTAPPHPPPPSAAAPPGVHAQVAQNGTVYYHQPPVRLNVYTDIVRYYLRKFHPIPQWFFNYGSLDIF